MMTKEQLRKQADFVASEFTKLNDEFLTMYGYLILDQLNGRKPPYRKEINSLVSKSMLRTRTVKRNMDKVFKRQIKEYDFKKKMDDYFVMFPSELDDLHNNMVISVKENGKVTYLSLNDAVKRIDDADENKLERLAKQIADSGLRVIYNDTSYRIDNFVRYAVLKGIKDINLKVQDVLAEEMGANGWEIDYHDNPRPSHAYMGGKQFVIGKARRINGIFFESFEEVALPRLIEPNCLHFKIPIICGVTKPQYDEEQLAKWKEMDASKVKYKERTYTKYEATQVQKRLEEAIRQCDDRLKIASPAQLDYLRRIELSKRRTLFKEYERFSKACGLEMKMKNR